MEHSLQVYRDAIAQRVHAICLDRNLDPASVVNTETNCRIEQYLPLLVTVALRVGPHALGAFQAAIDEAICVQCRAFDAASDTCPNREQAACCLYRYLPLIYEAISSVRADAV